MNSREKVDSAALRSWIFNWTHFMHKLKHKKGSFSLLDSLSLSLSRFLRLPFVFLYECGKTEKAAKGQRGHSRRDELRRLKGIQPAAEKGGCALVGWLETRRTGRKGRSDECRFGRSVCRSVGWLGYTIFHVITDIKCQKIFALSVAPCSPAQPLLISWFSFSLHRFT